MAEHLFFPETPQKPLRIEYNGPLYDGAEWDEYPIRHGWKDEKGEETWTGRDRKRVECWLYFGMLFYVFGEKLDQSDFILSEEVYDDYYGPRQKQFLTTTHLHKYIDDAQEWESKKYGERAVTIVEKVCNELENNKDKFLLRDDMKLAIRLICRALWNATVKRDGKRTEPQHVSKWLLSNTYETAEMIRSGWCPWEIVKARFTGCYVDTIAYLLQLDRKKPTWDNRTHLDCKMTECVAHNIDESTYLMRHVAEGCECDCLQADAEQLQTILKNGDIPLVKITPLAGESDDPGFKVEIVRKRTGRPYVAISHVWSDGMGNPDGNWLHSCQVGLLYEQARRLVSDKKHIPRQVGDPLEHVEAGMSRLAHFAINQTRGKDKSVLVWIDTLCVPHERDARNLAIQRIRQVYLDGMFIDLALDSKYNESSCMISAYRVLIFDSEMRQVESNSISRAQLLTRVVFCSGWMRRLWTLQEGLAAKYRLYMLFSDQPVNIATIGDELLTKADKNKLPILQESIAKHAMAVWFIFFKESVDYASKFLRTLDVLASPFMKPSFDKGHILSSNWYNVGTRTATKPGDRPIILAGVLDMDVKPILDAKGPEERMRVFYSMLNEFPYDILFEAEPRFEDEGMRWAVKACQYSSTPHFLGGESGKITPRGLQVSALSSWLFPSVVALDISSEDFQSTSGDWLVQHNLKGVTQPDACTLHFKSSVKLMPDKVYGVILESHTGQHCPFALVEYQSTEADNVHYARHVGVGFARRVLVWGLLPQDGYLLPFGFKSLEKRVWVVG
ncbi:uncharacterized protein BHQ10_009258 [Talaromyces amestolkiae]|uniref:Heterokaryon incompatibility domain-containing protein n=1 Tax=Talaromyces amestolkiae TaxID=1196081 RepID=A0A364LBP6_TALAM|nr:uncharacterized protein BHQ10_009258 [Talaromyces amestolkiae]RAO73246.1 hypothetical protein BHQ10_009258 [Talaromyces amestolkiae]